MYRSKISRTQHVHGHRVCDLPSWFYFNSKQRIVCPFCIFILLTISFVLGTAHNVFDYKLNATICDDSTACPSPGNQNCCQAKGGKIEISFHNNAIIPNSAGSLESYYRAAGYTFTLNGATTANQSTMTSISPTSVQGLGSSSVSTNDLTLSVPNHNSTFTKIPIPNPEISQISNRSIVEIAVGRIATLSLLGFLTLFVSNRRRNPNAVRISDVNENGIALNHWDGNLQEMNGAFKPSEKEDTSHPRVYVNAPKLPASQCGEDPHMCFSDFTVYCTSERKYLTLYSAFPR